MTGTSLLLLCALALGPQGGTDAAAELADQSPPAEPRDLRGWEVLDLDCSSDLGRRRTTLFGNGTVRLKIYEGESEEMRLRELAPEQYNGYFNRLRQEDLTETESSARSASGEWVDTCELTLDLPEAEPWSVSFARYDSLSLALSHVVTIAEEITTWAQEEQLITDFPEGWEPRPGDVLKRKDGALFEVIAFTSDQRGVELRGVDQPLVIYVMRDEVVGEFLSMVERRRLP